MPGTEIPLDVFGTAWERQAEQYAADPAQGHAAGYTPQYPAGYSSREVGGYVQRSRGRTAYAAWLRGIVAQDCPSFIHASFEEGMGEGKLGIHLILRAINGQKWRTTP